MKAFLAELRRRNVLKVATAYVVVAWLIMQIVDVAFPAFQMPPWTVTFVASLLVIGFPVTLIIAWAFELTPEGVVRSEGGATPGAGRGLNYLIVGALVVAVGFFLADRYAPAECR